MDMKWQVRTSVLSLLLALSSGASAQQRYSCQWISEVTPDAVIRFTSTYGTGFFNGALFYEGKRLMSFSEGYSQGYGSHWWRGSTSNGDEKEPSGDVVVFKGNQTIRGTAWNGKRPVGTQRLLLVGLGGSLYYWLDHRWRNEKLLFTAAEGFWRPSTGCRDLL